MPPVGTGDGAAPTDDPLDTEAKTDSNRTPPGCPSGQVAFDDDSLIGRRTSKWVSHVGQRYS